MRRVTKAVLARPRTTIAAWLAAIAVLAVLGIGVESRLTPTQLALKGTESGHAQALLDKAFGSQATISVLLQGPPAQLDREGTSLTSALQQRPDVDVLSPWLTGQAGRALHPRPDAALLVVDLDQRPGESLYDLVPQLKRFVSERLRPPVRSSFTGDQVVGQALIAATISSTRRAELIALPVLAIVLLLVFRSPLAATLPGLFGAATVAAGYGVIRLLTGAFALDQTSISLLSMMGLALGIDYSLLMVSRFREALRVGEQDRAAAVAATAATAGRTVLFAGIVLTAAMVTTLLLSPAATLLSVAVGVITVAVLSVGSALVVMPALLWLVGANIDRWRLGRGSSLRRLPPMSRTVARHPAPMAVLALLSVLALAAPALRLSTGTSDAELLPQNNQARQAFGRFQAVLGPGWAAPFEIIVQAHAAPITTRRRLDALLRFQRSVAGDPQVAFVAGPQKSLARFSELAALTQASPRQREQVETVVNVDRGGRAARILVIPRNGSNDPRTKALRGRLVRTTNALGRQLHASAAVGGTGAELLDYDQRTAGRLPLLMVAIAVVAYFALVPVLRALLLPLIAVALNLLAVSVAFGVIALAFQGHAPALGGPGYVDVIAVSGIFAVVFGLSIDYQVFLLGRIREGYYEHRDAGQAIDYGLRQTAGIVTGAAAIMVAVFLAFASAPFVSVRQFGVGLAAAVLLDATLIRLVLLPALLRLAGQAVWWLPNWLDRILPKVDVDGDQRQVQVGVQCPTARASTTQQREGFAGDESRHDKTLPIGCLTDTSDDKTRAPGSQR